MPDNINRMSLDEFRAGGYLQEVNRQFFHPLGLALEISVDNAGHVTALGGIWDYRDEPDGMRYGKVDLRPHADKIDAEWDARTRPRVERLGWMVQPAEDLTDQP